MKLQKNNLVLRNYWPCIIFLLGAFFAVTTIYGVYINYSPVPFWDEWHGSLEFMMAVQNGDGGAWFRPHNEHRILFSKLLTWLDYMIWGGLNKFPLFMSVLIQILTVALFAYIVHRFSRKRFMTLFTIGAGLGLLFSWVQVENWTWGFQNQFFAVYTFALLSFFSFVYHHSLYDQNKLLHSWLFFIISIISTIMSTLTMSNGLLVFPLLLILALVLKVSFFKSFFIGAIGLITWLLYFGNNYSVSHVSPIDSIINYPLQLLLYSFAYLGSPTAFILGFATHYLKITIAVGAVLALCLSYFIIDMARKREYSPIKLILVFFILFIFGSALVTAFGRIHFGLGTALAVRYSTPALLVWFSVLIMCYEQVESINSKYHKYMYSFVNILTVLLLLMLLPIQNMSLNPNYTFLFHKDAALLALSMDVREEQYIEKIYYGTLDQVIAIAREARTLEIGVFNQDWYRRVQHSGNEYIDIQENGVICKGNIDTVEYVSENNVYRIKGWVLDKNNRQLPSHLIVATPDGKVIGYGVSGEPRPDVSSVYEEAPKNTGWLAYVNYFDWERAFIFAVSENGLCKIPGEVKLGEVQTAIKSLSLSDEFIGISNNTSIKIIKNDWLEDAFPVEIDKNEIISDMQILSSWINSDEAIGILSFEFVIEDRQLHLPYITGPVSNNQRINIFEKVNDEYLLILKGVLPASVHVWSYMIIDLDIDQGSVIRVDLVDDGAKWGEWSAVAMPLY